MNFLHHFWVRVSHPQLYPDFTGNLMVALLATVYLLLAVANSSCPPTRRGAGALFFLRTDRTCQPLP